jgi:signal transduction histidine kinase
MELMQLLFFRDIFFIAVVYLLSLYFVKSSLKNLKKLTHYAKNLDFNRLTTPLNLKGHPQDEIKVIAEAFNASLERIHTQIQTLKDFIANASHELKTPLMMISSEIDIALKQKDYEERLINTKQHVKRISELLDTLSLITRLESGTEIKKEEIKVFPLVQKVIEQMKQKYPKKKIEIQGETNMVLQAHPRLLEIVLKNLIENACKHTGTTKVKITVNITEEMIAVQDTGKGIAPAFQEKIFERFRQLEKTENRNPHNSGSEHSF